MKRRTFLLSVREGLQNILTGEAVAQNAWKGLLHVESFTLSVRSDKASLQALLVVQRPS